MGRLSKQSKQYIKRKKKLELLGFESYDKFLASSQWARVKIEIENRYPEQSSICHFCKKTRDVFHHQTYNNLVRFKSLIPVCNSCHLAIHTIENEKAINTQKATEIYRKKMKVEKFKWREPAKIKDTQPKELERINKKGNVTTSYYIPLQFRGRIIRKSGLPESFHHSIHASITLIGNGGVGAYMEKMDSKMKKRKYEQWQEYYPQYRDHIELYAMKIKRQLRPYVKSPTNHSESHTQPSLQS